MSCSIRFIAVILFVFLTSTIGVVCGANVKYLPQIIKSSTGTVRYSYDDKDRIIKIEKVFNNMDFLPVKVDSIVYSDTGDYAVREIIESYYMSEAEKEAGRPSESSAQDYIYTEISDSGFSIIMDEKTLYLEQQKVSIYGHRPIKKRVSLGSNQEILQTEAYDLNELIYKSIDSFRYDSNLNVVGHFIERHYSSSVNVAKPPKYEESLSYKYDSNNAIFKDVNKDKALCAIYSLHDTFSYFNNVISRKKTIAGEILETSYRYKYNQDGYPVSYKEKTGNTLNEVEIKYIVK